MKQLLEAVACMHKHNIMHRDLKTSNLLYSNDGLLKVCDFGLARTFDPCNKVKQYTSWVVTLWYRAPELLLGKDTYNQAVDIWSVGCIFAELILREPIFSCKTEQEALEKIFRVLGNPTEERWPGW